MTVLDTAGQAPRSRDLYPTPYFPPYTGTPSVGPWGSNPFAGTIQMLWSALQAFQQLQQQWQQLFQPPYPRPPVAQPPLPNWARAARDPEI
jgi:hypothetical protein